MLGGGGGSLSSPFDIITCVSCDYPFTCFGYFFLCFLLFVGFLSSFSLPFSGFLFCFSFAASSSRSLSLPPSPLSSCYFLAFPSFALFSLLSSAFLFLPLLLFPSFPSPSSSFSFPFWFLLLSPLAPLSRLLSRLSLPFLLLLPFLLFLLCPLPSSLFLFRLRFFPATLFFPSCWLFFLLVCPRYLFCGFLFFLFVLLAFGFRFLLVCVFGLFWPSLCFSCWCFWSRGFPFVPVSLSSLLISRRLLLVPLLLLLSSSRLFLVFPLLCLFFLLFFYFVPSCRLCCCASLSPAPSYFASLSFAHSSVLSLPLCGGGGGGLAPAQWLCYMDSRRWSLLFIRGFLHGFYFLFSVPPAVASGSSSSAFDCCSAGSPFLFSGFAALGWGSAPAVFHGLVLPQVPRPSCLPLFSASGPPLLSCAISVSSRLCCFCLSSWSLGGSVHCF